MRATAHPPTPAPQQGACSQKGVGKRTPQGAGYSPGRLDDARAGGDAVYGPGCRAPGEHWPQGPRGQAHRLTAASEAPEVTIGDTAATKPRGLESSLKPRWPGHGGGGSCVRSRFEDPGREHRHPHVWWQSPLALLQTKHKGRPTNSEQLALAAEKPLFWLTLTEPWLQPRTHHAGPTQGRAVG